MINLFLNDRYFNSLDELKEFFASTSIDAGSMLAQEIYERVYGQDLRGWLEERCPDQTQLIEAVKQIDSAPILPIVDLLNRVIALFTGVSGHVANPDFHDHAKLIGEPEKRLNESGDRFSSVKFIFQVFQPLNASYLLELKSQDGKEVFASQSLSLDVNKGSADIPVVFTNIPVREGLLLVVDGTLKVYVDHAYHVGDYYKDLNKEGVVFWVDRKSGNFKIVSMQESDKLKWSLKYDSVVAESNTDGIANMRQVKQLPNWQINYPAFAWCASLGEGWYLPAKEELELLKSADIDKVLAEKGGKKLGASSVWSSTVAEGYTGHFSKKAYRYAWFEQMGCVPKDNEFCVRAVCLITARDAEGPQPVESRRYKVGDFYNDGKKQGVIFEVDESGQHGKIVSMTQSKDVLKWALGVVSETLTHTENTTYGRANMQAVQQQPNWLMYYPAFAWCASLGEGWYLPAIEELKCFTLNDEIRNAVNKTLATHNGDRVFDKGDCGLYWSSTTFDSQLVARQPKIAEYDKRSFRAWLVNMSFGRVVDGSKKDCTRSYARAITTF